MVTVPADRSGRSRLLVTALLVGISTLAFADRVLPALAVVFPAPGEVRLLGYDAYYHLRHAQFAAVNFPELQRWDVGTHYPTGQRSDAAGLFDLTIAAVAIAISGEAPGELAVFQTAAWFPPVFLLLAFPSLYWFARYRLAASWALVACAVYLLSPGVGLVRTMLGFADHHVAEILLALLSTAGLAHCLESKSTGHHARRWLSSLGAALPMALFVYTWLGAPIFLLLIGVSVALVCLLEIARGPKPRDIGWAAFRYGAALLAWLWLSSTLWPALVMERSLFPLVLAACGALALGPLILTHGAGVAIDRGLNPTGVAWVSLWLVALSVGAVVLLHPAGRDLVSLLFAVKTDLISEHRAVSPKRFWYLFGPAGVLALAGLPVGARAAWRQRDGRLLLPVVLGAGLVGLWWRTHDYGYFAPPFVAVLSAVTGAELLIAIRSATLRRIAIGALAGLFLFPLWPSDGIRRPYYTTSWMRGRVMMGEGWFQAMRWLRENSPEPTLPVDARVPAFESGDFAYPEGAYGVMTAWEYGGFLAVVGRRPPVWSRGSDNDPTGAWLLEEDESESLELLCPGCRGPEQVRYVVVDARTAADSLPRRFRQAGLDPRLYRETVAELDGGDLPIRRFRLNDRYDRSMMARLYVRDGSGLGHYRMVFESPHQSWIVSLSGAATGKDEFRRRSYPIDNAVDRERFRGSEDAESPLATSSGYAYDGVVMASVKIFERVEGALLTGSAPGASEVEVRLALHSQTTDRDFEYRTSTPLTRDGEFELVVPYSTRESKPAAEIAALGPYSLRVVSAPGADASEVGRVDVSPDQIRIGARIELGSVWRMPP